MQIQSFPLLSMNIFTSSNITFYKIYIIFFVNGLKIAHYKTPPEHAIIIPHTGGVIHDTKATARLGQSC